MSKHLLRGCHILLAVVILGLANSRPAAATEPSPCIDLSGHWSGTWKDCGSGHHGPLHATFCRTDDCHYHVVFSGRFWGIFPFRFKAELNVAGQQGDRLSLSGTQRAGISGTFEYNASASNCDFSATFDSKRYHGVFELTRDR